MQQHEVSPKRHYHFSPVINPDPQGGYNPQFSYDTPQPSEVQRGLSGGVYGGIYVIVMEGVINVVKY